MRRRGYFTFIILALIATAASLQSARSRTPARQLPGIASKGDSASPWISIREKLSCDELDPTSCPGRFLFVVLSNGRYSIEDPDGNIASEGTLSEREFAALDEDAQINAEANATAEQKPRCVPTDTLPGEEDQIKLEARGRINRVFLKIHNQLCITGDPVSVEQLQSDLHAVLMNHFTVPR